MQITSLGYKANSKRNRVVDFRKHKKNREEPVKKGKTQSHRKMFDKDNWSFKKFSWYYALSMAFTIVICSFLLLHFQIIETVNLRLVYIPVLLTGTILCIRDVVKHSSKLVGFTKAFVFCFRTGIYTCIALLPVVLIILSIGMPHLNMIDQNGRFDASEYQTGFMFSKLFETFAMVLISSLLGAFIPGMKKKL